MSMNGEIRQITAEQMTRIREKATIDALVESEGFSLDKLWHALHVLLCGETYGQSAALDGKAIRGYDLGYGPPMYLTAQQVAEYARQLAEMSDADIRDRFDPEAMRGEDVYVVPDDVEELVDAFRRLLAYYQDAASKGNGMLHFLV